MLYPICDICYEVVAIGKYLPAKYYIQNTKGAIQILNWIMQICLTYF